MMHRPDICEDLRRSTEKYCRAVLEIADGLQPQIPRAMKLPHVRDIIIGDIRGLVAKFQDDRDQETYAAIARREAERCLDEWIAGTTTAR